MKKCSPILVRLLRTDGRYSAPCLQYHRGNGFNHNSLASQPTQSRHNRDRHQRADDHERLPDDEGEDDPKDCGWILEVPHHRCMSVENVVKFTLFVYSRPRPTLANALRLYQLRF